MGENIQDRRQEKQEDWLRDKQQKEQQETDLQNKG